MNESWEESWAESFFYTWTNRPNRDTSWGVRISLDACNRDSLAPDTPVAIDEYPENVFSCLLCWLYKTRFNKTHFD